MVSRRPPRLWLCAKAKDKLTQIIESYILEREQMTNLFLLIDIRHEPLAIDLEFIEWLGENGIPFSIVFTKADKLGTQRQHENVERYLNRLAEQWEELPPHFITSSEKGAGRDDLLSYIEQINKSLLPVLIRNFTQLKPAHSLLVQLFIQRRQADGLLRKLIGCKRACT